MKVPYRMDNETETGRKIRNADKGRDNGAKFLAFSTMAVPVLDR